MDEQKLIEEIEVSYRCYCELFDKLDQNKVLSEGIGQGRTIEELLNSEAEIQDEVIDYRLKKIIREERPYIPKIRHQGGCVNPNHTFEQVVQHFLRQRRDLLILLNRLPRESWNRTGLHELEGHVSFRELIRRFKEKDQEILGNLQKAAPTY